MEPNRKMSGVFLRGRQGNLLVVVMFAVAIAIVSFTTLMVVTSTYASQKENAKQYANIQSYRAAAEIACYQYITDLCVNTETLDLSSSFITPSGPAMYNEALRLLQEAVGERPNPDEPLATADPLVWRVSTISAAISGATVSHPDAIMDLIALCSKGLNEFELRLEDYPEILWGDEGTDLTGNEVTLVLAPLEIHVRLRVRGEILNETFYAHGLCLSVIKEGPASTRTLTMRIVEPENGVRIYRD